MSLFRTPLLSRAALAAGISGALAACGGGDASSSGTAPPGPVPEGPTYYQDVAPILSRNCSGCHVEGGIAPFSFATAEAAISLAPAIMTAVSDRSMPPWPPGPASPAMEHDRSLSQADIDLLVAWAEAGAPAGDPAKAAALIPPEVIDIGPVEVSKDIGTDYVPDSQLTDDYHCFMVDLGLTEDRIATGFRIIPGNGKTVHHVTTSAFDEADRPAVEALDAQTPDVVGWPCFGGVANVPGAKGEGSIGSWVPGVSAEAYPAGTGRTLSKGSVAVLQVHYNLAGGTDPDRTRIELALAPKEKEASLAPLFGVRLAKPNLNIPANQSGVVAEQELTATQWSGGKFFPDGDGYILGVGGHMHLLGRSITLTLTNESGATTLLDIPAWDFHWQGSYALVEPIRVGATDKVSIRCTYDNSEEWRMQNGLGMPEDVSWGEGTTDEMCLASLSVTDEVPALP
jgi:hypothetical protein